MLQETNTCSHEDTKCITLFVILEGVVSMQTTTIPLQVCSGTAREYLFGNEHNKQNITQHWLLVR